MLFRLGWITAIAYLLLRSIEHSPWLGATLVTLGGDARAVPLFWTLVGPLAAIALIVLSIRAARRTRAAT